MQNKTAYTDFILTELNKGNVQYKDVCGVFCGKFGLTENTFIKYWKQANERHTEQRQAIEAAKLEQTIKTEKEVVKRQIKSKSELLLKLNDIIEQKAKRIEGQIIMPSHSDVARAIDLYCRIQGHYAPMKKEVKKIGKRQHFNVYGDEEE